MSRPKPEWTIIVKHHGRTVLRLGLVPTLPGEWQVWRDGKLARVPYQTTTAIFATLRSWISRR